jgi:hypothetical protein
MTICPVCHSERVHRSRRRGIKERAFLTAIFVKPFRCQECAARASTPVIPAAQKLYADELQARPRELRSKAFLDRTESVRLDIEFLWVVRGLRHAAEDIPSANM